jgi:inositol phosphorylceramide mannosyltransferase catalytic subunit
MGSMPRHPLFLHIIQSLQAFDRDWYAPYITVMYTTGPLFLSVMWKEYMRVESGREDDRVRVLGIEDVGGSRWGYWANAGGGSSWHKGDAKFILWVRFHVAVIYDKRTLILPFRLFN